MKKHKRLRKKRMENKSKNVSFRKLVNIPSTTHATFGLYRYPAKFIPHVVAYVMENYAKEGMSIFDPFGGCGTTGIVSRIYGHDYELWDLNPIIKILHQVAIMKPVNINSEEIIKEMRDSKKEFIPNWSRLSYWYPQEFLPFLYKVWGYYHSFKDSEEKNILVVPLLKISRYFSYDDSQRQKLSKSTRSQDKIKELLKSDWQNIFFEMLKKEINKVIIGIKEYSEMSPKNVKAVIRGGVDSLGETLNKKRDILITSPPYIQSQEYMRQAKLDLFWLGYTEEDIKKLSKLELPYRHIEPIEIHSKTFFEYRNKIKGKHIQEVYDKYFWSILGLFTQLQKDINSRMFIFVGNTSAEGISIPLDRIIIEHLENFGWEHEITLIDTIVSRRLFSYKVNPASERKDKRTNVENLVILKKINN